MDLTRYFRQKTQSVKGNSGVARADMRTKNLTKRLGAGEIAIINHEDIDLVSAEALVECKPIAVLNAAKSTSGRYPNLGPGILLDAGIILIDDLGPEIFAVEEGQVLTIGEDGEVFRGEEKIAQGIVQTISSNKENMQAAEAGLPDQLKAFATNTMEYVDKEQDIIFGGLPVPEVKTVFQKRHALVVVRGYRYKEDLEVLRHYIREYRPIIIGVDGGADAVLDAGLKLDMIVGDMDSVSDRALKSGAEIVVHAYRDGRAPGQKRMQELGIEHIVFPATGTSEDIAMLLANDKGASLIVAVGSHSTLIEYLDKGRRGMASTFLTRLQIGSKLIDAKGVSQLYRSRISNWQLWLLIIAGIFAVGAAMYATATGQILLDLVQVWFANFFHWIKNIF
ncbi:MAG: putative cytokinetic ring protein SteA [Arcanobacterium sp.]|nr:putative cytokinetic ring protein SteA [Arcanobacterium sp.]